MSAKRPYKCEFIGKNGIETAQLFAQDVRHAGVIFLTSEQGEDIRGRHYVDAAIIDEMPGNHDPVYTVSREGWILTITDQSPTF